MQTLWLCWPIWPRESDVHTLHQICRLASPLCCFSGKTSGFVRFHVQAFILNAVNFLLTALIGGIIIASITAAAQRAQTWEDVGATLAGVGIITTIVIIISLVITIFAIVALVSL